MSSMGTGPAAGVAQAALQAQEVARNRDSKQAQSGRAAERLRKQIDEHLSVLDEADTESPDQLSIGDHMPDKKPPDREDIESREAVDESADDPTTPSADGQPPSGGDDGLYQHLDVQA